MGRHSILLVQNTNNPGSRTYYDYETIPEAMDGVCRLFEDQLKRSNPNLPNITYDISDLYKYIDTRFDISLLALDQKTLKYEPYGRDWIKNRVLNHLKKLSQPN